MRRVVFLLAAFLLIGGAGGQPRPTEPAIAWGVDRDAALEGRLGALDPRVPMGYFELGEEVVSSFPDAEGYRLARELFALAYALAERNGGGSEVARSVALAIAEVTPDDAERRWLVAMARSLRPGTRAGGARGETPREREQAAEMLALHRGGEFRRLRPMLRSVELGRVLREAGLDDDEARRLAERVVSDAENLTDEGRTSRRGRREEALTPHPRNGGNPGPALGPDDFLASLRAEALLVGGEPASWGADLGVRGNAPARDLDPGELLAITGVDASRSRWENGPNGWRDGRWVTR